VPQVLFLLQMSNSVWSQRGLLRFARNDGVRRTTAFPRHHMPEFCIVNVPQK
jgi:hypothetical protein